MSACRLRRGLAVRPRPAADRLERRALFDAAVATVSLTNDVNYPTTPATDVAVDGYGDVYATRVGGDGTDHTQLVVVQAGDTAPEVLASFGPIIEYDNTVEQPYGQMVLDSAGDVFGVTRFVATGEIPLGQDYTQGVLWELPAGFGVVDVLARFYKPETLPRSLTVDGSGNLYGVVDSLLGDGSSVFEYPADETGLTTVSLGAGTYASSIVADKAEDVFGTLASSDDPSGPFSLFEVAHGGTSPKMLATVPATMGYDVAGLTRDVAGNLFITTQQGPNGGTLLELPAGAKSVRLLPGGTGQAFNGKPLVDEAGDVFATAGNAAAGTSVLLELPTGGAALRTVATFATGYTSDVSIDALGNLHGTYADTVTGQATIYSVSGRSVAVTPAPTPATPTPTPTLTVTGLAPTVSRSGLPPTVVGGTKEKRSVTVSVTNTSAASLAGTATIAVYATPVGSAAASGVLLATVAKPVSLAAGGGTSWAIAVKPTALAANTYALLAVATDPTGVAIAANTGPTLAVFASTVSLAATVAPTSTAVKIGGWVTLTLALTNGGTADSAGPVMATLGLTAADGTAVALGTVRRRVVVKAGGKPTVVKLRLRLPATAVAGRYVPTVTIVQGASTASAVGTTAVDLNA